MPGTSRRAVLGSALAMTALAVPPAARAIAADTVGARRGVTTTLQEQIDAVAAAGGGTVQLPAGTHLLSQPLEMRSGVTLAGAGPGLTILRDAPDLGAKPLVVIIGTPTERVSDVSLTGLTLRNGDAQTGQAPAPEYTTSLSSMSKDGIEVEYTNGLLLDNIEVTEIAGLYGFRCKMTSNVTCQNSRFYRCTYTQFAAHVESEFITVTNCEFDTVTASTTAYPNTYLFCTGYDKPLQGSYLCRDVLVEDSTFRNNPTWQGINTHGGERMVFRNNHVENVLCGMIIANVIGHTTESSLTDIVVEGNIFVQGTAGTGVLAPDRTADGIRVAGGSPATRGRDIQIIDNTFIGFGGNVRESGTITFYCVEDILIEGNTIQDYGQHGVLCRHGSFGARIIDNTFTNLARAAPGQETRTAVIATLGDGFAHGVEVTGNTVSAGTTAEQPQRFILVNGVDTSFQISNNTVSGIAQSPICHPAPALPVNRDTLPQAYLIQRTGDLILDSAGQPRWSVTAPTFGYGSLDTTTVIATVAVTAGSTLATIIDTDPVRWSRLPPTMNVVIAGAGVGAAPLHTRVVDVRSTTTVELADAAATTVTAAVVTRAALQLSPVP